MPKTKPIVTSLAPIEPLLTPDDVAALLKVHKRTVTRLCEAGDLPMPFKVGGGLRWKANDVQEFLDGLKRTSDVCAEEQES